MKQQRRQRKDATSSAIRQRARELCKEMTPAEKALWQRLRNRQLGGLKFRRQHPIGHFIVDFYCAAHRLIVEVDGPIHTQQAERDQLRTDELINLNCRVLRFTNDQVMNHIDPQVSRNGEEGAVTCGVDKHGLTVCG